MVSVSKVAQRCLCKKQLQSICLQLATIAKLRANYTIESSFTMENLILNFNKKTPLYRQLYTHIANEIRTGVLKNGEKLPSKRRLAQNLSVSINTVDTAYQMLVAEGYVTSKPRSGYRACLFEHLDKPEITKQKSTNSENVIEQSQKTHDNTHDFKYNFGTAGIDTTLFPFKTWCGLQKEVFAESSDILNHGHRQGDIELRHAIANHLREYRATNCGAHQIIVGAGIEYLLGLLAQMFAKSTFAVENPGYYRATDILKNSGTAVINAPVDEYGMSADFLQKSSAKLAYITPSHQFPTGVTMPTWRRMALLNWAAQKKERYIIEDDYNSEFRFDGKPLPSLQGLSDGGKVIYISTFSKSIAPAIRIAYMVLPEKLLQKYNEIFGMYSCTVSRFEQQTLAKFILGGYFARHLARLKTQYKKRRDALVEALCENFGEDAVILGRHTGLHLVLQTKQLQGCGATSATVYEKKLLNTAQSRGVKISCMYMYYNDDKYDEKREKEAMHGVVLGYGGLTLGDIQKAVHALKSAWQEV